jgi:hypothetical protein
MIIDVRYIYQYNNDWCMNLFARGRYKMDTTDTKDLQQMREATQAYLDTDAVAKVLQKLQKRLTSTSPNNATEIARMRQRHMPHG